MEGAAHLQRASRPLAGALYIKPEAERVAAAVWWGRLTIEDAAQELRGIAYLKATAAKVAPELADAVAISALDEAMQSHEAEHAASVEAMTEAALVAIRANGSRAEVRAAVAAEAQRRPLPPMPHLLDVAAEEAAQRHRRAESWWKRREPAA